MLRRAALALGILLGLPLAGRAALLIDVGHHVLSPGQSNLEIDIFVSSPSGAIPVQGTDLSAQVADGGLPAGGVNIGPTISGDLVGVGTLFNGNNTGDADAGSIPMAYFHETTTAEGMVNIPTTPVLLVKLFFDTTGFTAASPGDLGNGHWSLRLNNTANGPTDFGGTDGLIPASIIDGDIQIVPEPASIGLALLAAAGLAAVLIRRRYAR